MNNGRLNNNISVNSKNSKPLDKTVKQTEIAVKHKKPTLFNRFFKSIDNLFVTSENKEKDSLKKHENEQIKTNEMAFEKNVDENKNLSSFGSKMQDVPSININETCETEGKSKRGSMLKFLSNKNARIALVVLVVGVALLFAISSFGSGVSNNNTENFNNVSFISSLEYSEKLEEKLMSVLSKIQGAGNVSCMITLNSGPEFKIATSVDEKTTTVTNGDKTETLVTVVETPILISVNGEQKPLILMEIMPKLKGVIVVAQGAKDVKVKLELLQAVQALLDVSSENIQIFSGI